MRRSGLWLWITVWVCTAAVAQPHNSLSPREQRFGWKLLFNGNDLSGWTVASSPEAWRVEDGTIYCTGKGRGFLYSNEQYKNFVLRLDFKMSPNANSGVFVRIWDRNDPVNTGMEIQILDSYGKTEPWQARLRRAVRHCRPSEKRGSPRWRVEQPEHLLPR
jgi:hypothetical protein